MKPEFWLERWQKGQTGWHQPRPLPLLTEHWAALHLPYGTRVLVPLCGKSLDVAWLAAQGLSVLGLELSPLAVSQFFAEHKLEPTRSDVAHGVRWQANGIEILCGDLFQLSPALWSDCGAIYDRAAIVALPPATRQRYTEHIYAHLPHGCQGLMATLEYPQTEMQGPPFCVEETEVRQLLGTAWSVTRRDHRELLEHEPHFRERGLTRFATTLYELQRATT
ncbi:MAG TPA: thiopurine S-methyltransferase [Nevskiaceae bacterium]|nr:thiopurine S-methyltransferase [Nevskiaceae bacterium]